MGVCVFVFCVIAWLVDCFIVKSVIASLWLCACVRVSVSLSVVMFVCFLDCSVVEGSLYRQ